MAAKTNARRPVTQSNRWPRVIIVAGLFGLALFGYWFFVSGERSADYTPAPVAAPAVPAATPELRPPLTLVSLVKPTGTATALATIRHDETGLEQTVRAGDLIFDVARLEEILEDSVLVLYQERLVLLRSPNASVGAVPTLPELNTMQGSSLAEQIAQQERAAHIKAINEAENPWNLLHYEPVHDGERLVGLQLASQYEDEFLGKFGLQRGDIITRANGYDIDGPAGLMSALESLGKPGIMRLDVRRNHRLVPIVFENPQAPRK